MDTITGTERPIACLDLSLPTPAENLALDEALLDSAEADESGEILRFWESPQLFVILGAGCRTKADVNLAECAARAIPVLRRCSGGGTVLQGTGCVNWVLVLRTDRDRALATINGAYAYVMQGMCRALLPHLPGVGVHGISDLAIGGMKLGGTAQRRKRNHLLIHGTFLHGFDLELVSVCLHMPERQPEYRAGRPHDAFIRNAPLTPEEFRLALCAEWNAAGGAVPPPMERVRELVANKYATDGWTACF